MVNYCWIWDSSVKYFDLDQYFIKMDLIEHCELISIFEKTSAPRDNASYNIIPDNLTSILQNWILEQ